MRPLYTATIFLGSALLFLVQPLAAKSLLPVFGGSPAVWTTSVLFFQALLLAGYAYAHFGLRHLPPSLRAPVHLLLVALALVLCWPLVFRASPELATRAPVPALLGTLTSAAGPLFLVLSSGSPLLQRWFSLTADRAASRPYFLYAASNAGSLLGLLAFPFLLEPLADVDGQKAVLRWGALIWALLLTACAIGIRSGPTRDDDRGPAPPPSRQAWSERARWALSALIPSSLLLSVTTTLTTDLAPIPLLWVVPLSLYLVTFVLAFSDRVRISPVAVGRFIPILATPAGLVIVLEATSPLGPLAVLHLATFFVVALALHADLARRRPPPEHLTEFYLWIAIGGALGGLFNAVLAPLVFPTLLEYPLGLVLAALLRPVDRTPPRHVLDWAYPLALFAMTSLAVLAWRALDAPTNWARTAVLIGLPLVLAFLAAERPRRYALSLAAVFLASWLFQTAATGRVLRVERSFFGIHRVMLTADGAQRMLLHGNTVHGKQSVDPALAGIPLTYYHPTGPIGQIMRHYAERFPRARIGLVGLGVGSLAAYGEPEQTLTFYEIDPAVEKIARDERFFGFLSRARARVEVVLGDARLTLREAPPGGFDLLVVDAFSSDSIPVHLITKEAIALYLSRLRADGLLAFHISNRLLDLQPVLAAAARELGVSARVQEDLAVTPEEKAAGKLGSVWAILSPSPARLAEIERAGPWLPLEPRPGFRSWTDAYANVLSVVRLENLAGALAGGASE